MLSSLLERLEPHRVAFDGSALGADGKCADPKMLVTEPATDQLKNRYD